MVRVTGKKVFPRSKGEVRRGVCSKSYDVEASGYRPRLWTVLGLAIPRLLGLGFVCKRNDRCRIHAREAGTVGQVINLALSQFSFEPLCDMIFLYD